MLLKIVLSLPLPKGKDLTNSFKQIPVLSQCKEQKDTKYFVTVILKIFQKRLFSC